MNICPVNRKIAIKTEEDNLNKFVDSLKECYFKQGPIGDCYALAMDGLLSDRDIGFKYLKRLFRKMKDGCITFNFPLLGKDKPITVDCSEINNFEHVNGPEPLKYLEVAYSKYRAIKDFHGIVFEDVLYHIGSGGTPDNVFKDIVGPLGKKIRISFENKEKVDKLLNNAMNNPDAYYLTVGCKESSNTGIISRHSYLIKKITPEVIYLSNPHYQGYVLHKIPREKFFDIFSKSGSIEGGKIRDINNLTVNKTKLNFNPKPKKYISKVKRKQEMQKRYKLYQYFSKGKLKNFIKYYIKFSDDKKFVEYTAKNLNIPLFPIKNRFEIAKALAEKDPDLFLKYRAIDVELTHFSDPSLTFYSDNINYELLTKPEEIVKFTDEQKLDILEILSANLKMDDYDKFMFNCTKNQIKNRLLPKDNNSIFF